MEITEVRIKLMEDPSERLQAFCSLTFDDAFVIRDLKIIGGTNGPFVAMPSRKLTTHCPGCGGKNHLRAAFCNQCGGRLGADRAPRDEEGRTKLYADIAHPINSACREMIQDRVITEFRNELDRAKQPGYVSRYEDIDIDDTAIQTHAAHASAPPAPHHRPTAPAHAREQSAASRPAVQAVQPAEKLPRGPHRMPPAQVPAQTPAQAPVASQAAQAGNPRAGSAKEESAPPPDAAERRSQSGGNTPDSFGAGVF